MFKRLWKLQYRMTVQRAYRPGRTPHKNGNAVFASRFGTKVTFWSEKLTVDLKCWPEIGYRLGQNCGDMPYGKKKRF